MSNHFEDDFPTTPSMRTHTSDEMRSTLPDWSENPDELMGQLMASCTKTERRVKHIDARFGILEADQNTLLREVRQISRRVDDMFDAVRMGGKRTMLTTGAIVGVVEGIGQLIKLFGG